MDPEPPVGPFIGPGDEAPGRFVDGRWEGALDWCSRHGPAIVQWSVGCPTFIWDALAEDGNRVNLSTAMQPGIFRRRSQDGFIHGAVDIREGDVAFASFPEIARVDISEDLVPVFDVLSADMTFIADLEKDAFAGALYAVFENEGYVSQAGQIFDFGQRSAAAFVAALRGKGEIYTDYAWGRGPAYDAADERRVRVHLDRLGLRPRPLENGK